MPEPDIALCQPDATLYRSVTGLCQYVSEDRYDINYSTKELSKTLKNPANESWARARRVDRYLNTYPDFVLDYKWTRAEKAVLVKVDSDHAGCMVTRRSTSSRIILYNKGLVKGWSVQQPVVSLSSGESEFRSIVKGYLEGKLVVDIAEEWGDSKRLEIFSDSSAARAMTRRLGVGKVRHLSIVILFIQEVVKAGKVVIKKVLSALNESDLGTKYLDPTKMTNLIKRLPVSRPENLNCRSTAPNP